MSISLMFQSSADRDAAALFTSIKALGDECGRVPVDDATVVAAAALLEDAPLEGGETVTTYDFSMADDETGARIVEAHVQAFGPCLLAADKLEALRALVARHPGALAMLDHVVAERLQVSLSTSDLAGRAMPHLKGSNVEADEVSIGGSGTVNAILDRIAIGNRFDAMGEVAFDTFAAAVDEHGHRLGSMLPRVERFVACARRRQAQTVYWA